jgi:hypothetical protein
MIIFCIILLLAFPLHAQGDIYLVFGSDTSIWDGLDVNRYICHYKPETYSAPSSNAARVINESYRARLRDSAGRTMPITWWMHSGNVFRHADNNDVPLANTIAMHLMKRYHGETIARLGDELTLHYHTWDWTDENGDGLLHWNQAASFAQCREDFDLTLCHYLLEEENFPVSFRSGWHYMDNIWQACLDELIPFSLHNAYPAKRLVDDEPVDNIYDWSLASSEWVPFHPSRENYQLPGDSKGWNVRCIYLKSVTPTVMERMFARAAAGTDQLACLWSHLPETDFPEQLLNVHAVIAEAAKRYPGVRFHYMTAVEAYQAWLKTPDQQAPLLTFADQGSEEQPVFHIQSDEPLFQREPFVAIKDLYGRFQILPCTPTGVLTWQATSPLKRSQLAKAGVAVCDTSGNQTLRFIRYLPDDLYLDNESSGYRELAGTFTTIDSYAWGTNARAAAINPGDSAVIRFELPVPEKQTCQIFCQFAPTANPVDSIAVILTQAGRQQWRVETESPPAAKTWHRITTCDLDPAGEPALYVIARNRHAGTKEFSLDALRITPLIPDRQLEVVPGFLQFGETSLFTRVEKNLEIRNSGKEPLTIHSLATRQGLFTLSLSAPLVLPPFSMAGLTVQFQADLPVTATDTLVILSDDPVKPRYSMPLTVEASAYFVTIDNSDPAGYLESGDWHTSVAQAYGSSSRFVNLSGNLGAWAQFETILPRTGIYRISLLLPKTENATDHALYTITCGGVILDSLYINQNSGSGSWVAIGEYQLAAASPVRVRLIHAGGQSAGSVLRADALRFTLLSEGTGLARHEGMEQPGEVLLLPNYPNPFNSSTALRFIMPAAAEITLDIYDIQGRKVRSLFAGRLASGEHQISWDGRDEGGYAVASGLYFSVLFGRDFFLSRRLFLIR